MFTYTKSIHNFTYFNSFDARVKCYHWIMIFTVKSNTIIMYMWGKFTLSMIEVIMVLPKMYVLLLYFPSKFYI